jgi:hypothetical protein
MPQLNTTAEPPALTDPVQEQMWQASVSDVAMPSSPVSNIIVISSSINVEL